VVAKSVQRTFSTSGYRNEKPTCTIKATRTTRRQEPQLDNDKSNTTTKLLGSKEEYRVRVQDDEKEGGCISGSISWKKEKIVVIGKERSTVSSREEDHHHGITTRDGSIDKEQNIDAYGSDASQRKKKCVGSTTREGTS